MSRLGIVEKLARRHVPEFAPRTANFFCGEAPLYCNYIRKRRSVHWTVRRERTFVGKRPRLYLPREKRISSERRISGRVFSSAISVMRQLESLPGHYRDKTGRPGHCLAKPQHWEKRDGGGGGPEGGRWGREGFPVDTLYALKRTPSSSSERKLLSPGLILLQSSLALSS